MRRSIFKEFLAYALAFAVLATVVFPTDAEAYTVDGVVSVKTVNNDICLSTTANSAYSVDDVASGLDMNSNTAGSASRTSTTYIDVTDLSNWYVYDHYDAQCYSMDAMGNSVTTSSGRKTVWAEKNNYNENLRPYYEQYLDSSSIEKAFITGRTQKSLTIEQLMASSDTYTWGNVYNLYEHIYAANENGRAAMTFYGYPDQPYSDFLFYPAQASGSKRVKYTIDSRNVRTHSLNSAGFLFNTGVTKNASGESLLSGYAVIFQFYSAVAGKYIQADGIKQVMLYRIDGAKVEDMHAGTYLTNNNIVTQYGGTYIDSVNLSSTTEYPFTNHFDVSDIQLDITSNSFKLTMTEAGASADATNPDTKVLFNFSAASGNALADTGFGGMGPIVAYQSHLCESTSSYKYSNLQMSFTTTNSVLDGVNNIDYIDQGVNNSGDGLVDTNKYYVLIGDNTQGVDGYKDYFSLQDDAVFLEKLKKQGIVLVTNLNIEPVPNNINGTNYKLSDYLGEGNVIQVSGDSLSEITDAIKGVVGTNVYSVVNALSTPNALNNVISADGQSTASCKVTYKGYQVDTIDSNAIPSADGIELAITDPSPIGVTNPQYTITKPDYTVLNLGSTNTFTVTDNTSDWPAGEYKAAISYDEGITVSTTFSIGAIYDSYLNGVKSTEGTLSAGVVAGGGSIGEDTIISGEDFVVNFPKTATAEVPEITSVAVDTNHDGSISNSEKLASGDYTYTTSASAGTLVVPAAKTTGDIYIEAKQAYEVRKVTWKMDSITTHENLDYAYQTTTYRTSDAELNGKILWSDYRDNYGAPEVSVTVDGNEVSADAFTYDSTTGEFHMDKVYLTGDVVVTAKRNLEKAGIEVVTKNVTYTGPSKLVIASGDYQATFKAEAGYKLPDTITVEHKLIVGSGADEGYKEYASGDYTYDSSTGKLTIAADKLDGDIRITVKGVAVNYTVSGDITNMTYDGPFTGNVTQEYTGTIKKSDEYSFPASVEVYKDGELLSTGYTYDQATGTVTIDKGVITGNILVKGDGIENVYKVTSDLTNLTFSGENVCYATENYSCRITPATGYSLPTSVEVSVSGNAITKGYTYNKTKGVITVSAEAVRGDINIGAVAALGTNKVTFSGKHLNFTGNATVKSFASYEATITPAAINYVLPSSVAVAVSGNALASGDYKYDSTTGKISIPAGLIDGNVVITANGVEIILTEDQKEEQDPVNEDDLTIIPPTYEDSKDGKIIGVTKDMEYSLDNGKTWTSCKGTTITKLGVGTVQLRLKGTATKKKSAIVSIEIESSTEEYNIPTITMTKYLGVKQKFRIPIFNKKGGNLHIVSTNSKVATINKKGIIKTKKAGKTNIVFSILKGKHIVQVVIKLNVKKNIKSNLSLKTFDPRYTGPSFALYRVVQIGSKAKIKLTHTKGSTITYSSSDNSIVKVDKKGRMYGKSEGKAIITVTIERKNVADRYFVVVRVPSKSGDDGRPDYLEKLKY